MNDELLNFQQIKAVLFDMDGVIYRGNLPLPGVNELLQFLGAHDIQYACITNNSTRTSVQFAAKVQSMDLHIPAERIITSAVATDLYLRSIAPYGTPIYAIGMEGLTQPLFSDGHFVLDEHTPRYVVVGGDFDLTYAKLRTACLAIRAGATFIGTNPDTTFPAEDGIIPGCGAILAALQAATGREPLIIGKPEPALFDAAIQLLGGQPSTTLVVGDRYDTDIVGGARAGLKTAMVLTGVSTMDEAAQGQVATDLIVSDLPTLLDRWRTAIDL